MRGATFPPRISRGRSARASRELVAAQRRLRCGPWLWVLFALALAACEDRDVETWTPADHDHADKKAGQVSGTAAPGQEQASLVAVTWRQSCASCHGMGGRGDGPTGRMMKMPDLSRPELQNRSDEELAKVIREGRNQMPSFGSLPPAVVEGLVKHIRTLRR